MRYRPEIDGLRALAVVPVVLFHAGFAAFSGGFVGVDVFFVISGFLITTILLADLSAGQFSLVAFYERRALRILPALFVVMAACIPLAWLWLMPHEMKEFSESLIAVATFSSNVLFWQQSGYFDTAAELKPLLHTWSLAVEEQYYIFFPLCLALGWRLGRRKLTATLALVACLSLGLACWGASRQPAASFYLLPTRAWELLLGALIALCGESWASRLGSGIGRQWVSLSGLLFIMGAIVGFDKLTPYPSLWTLVPTGGAAMLIVGATSGTLAHAILSNRLAVSIGLISYSAYLWHQPLFALTRNVASQRPSDLLMLSLIAATFALAFLTWRYVETPFRTGVLKSRKLVVGLGAIFSAFFTAIGVSGVTFAGFPSRFDLHELYPGDVGHLEFHKLAAEKYFPCTPPRLAAQALKWEGFMRCLQSKPGPGVEVALVGDSHAEHLFLGLAETLGSRNVAFYIKSSAPFVGNPEFTDILKYLVESPSIKTVLVTMHWIGRKSEVPFNSTLEHELRNTVELLHNSGKRVYILNDVPRFGSSAERCKFGVRGLFSQDLSCSIGRNEVDSYESTYLGALSAVAREIPSVKLIDIRNYLCDGTVCSMVKDGVLMYRDQIHLNIPGSRYVGRRMVQDFPDLSD